MPRTTQSDRWGAILLGICMFSTGGAGLVVEYVIATTTTFILGSSIVVFSLIIAVMLGAMGVSGWIQERVGDNHLLEKFFAIEVTLAIMGGFAPIGLFHAYGAFTEHFNLILYSWTIGIGLLIGLEIPVVMRIIEQRGIGLRVNLKYVFGADYLGAMIFALAWVFWLLPNFPITEISFMVSGLNFLIALATVCYFIRLGSFSNQRIILLVAAAAVLVMSWGYMNNRDWNASKEQRLYEDPIVYQTTTKYQHLVVTRAEKTRCGVQVTLYINGNTQFGSCDEGIYHDNLVAPAMELAEHTDSVLILGGGDGLALRDVLRHEPKSIQLVDLDGGMLAIARDNEYLSALNQGAFDDARVTTFSSPGVTHYTGAQDFAPVEVSTGQVDSVTNLDVMQTVAQVRLMHIDAGAFLEQTRDTYDVIIIDLPDPSSVELSKLYTRSFYADVRARLRPGGVMVVQSTSPTHAKDVYLEIGRTMEAAGLEAIAYHDNVPSFGDWGYWMACAEYGCGERLRERIASLESFSVEPLYLTPERLRANLSFGKVNGVPFLESADSDRINTRTDPSLFMRYEAAWKSY